jgi:hypothetical protein
MNTFSTTAQYAATLFFVLAVLHTFCVKFFARQAHRYPKGSIGENIFHLLSEVEVVFGLWAGVFVTFLALSLSPQEAIAYVES